MELDVQQAFFGVAEQLLRLQDQRHYLIEKVSIVQEALRSNPLVDYSQQAAKDVNFLRIVVLDRGEDIEDCLQNLLHAELLSHLQFLHLSTDFLCFYFGSGRRRLG